MVGFGAPLREVELSAVNLLDHPFTPPPLPRRDLSSLRDSLTAVGLLAPPFLRGPLDGRWQVVAGLKRLQAARELGWEKVPAFALPPDAPDSRCLLMAIQDNALTRCLTPYEQVFWAPLLLAHWERDTVIQKFLPCLGLPPSPRHLDRLLAAAALEGSWQELLGQGRLALTAAARLAAWPPPDRAAAWPYLSALPFSQSKQEEFLEWVELLARREGSSPAALLSRTELTNPLSDQALDPQEKSQTVRQILKTWIFPALTAAREAFQRRLDRLGLTRHPRLHLAPPPAFEGPDFLLSVKFQDADELRKLLEELARLAAQEDFSRLMAL